ncbi:hypothetical protein [Hymenobacter sp. B81]|uniref:hypothetical protein n=1 Tax=Hymenobacter sp. B81 TaxID=3344878 RepID=UPI0037DC7A90
MNPVQPSEWKYRIVWVQLGQQEHFMLWIETPESEALWADAAGRVPSFRSLAELTALTDSIGARLITHMPELLNLDQVVEWLGNSAKQVPYKACLLSWFIFEGLASGAKATFLGNRGGPVCNRVFYKLYDNSGPWRLRPDRAQQVNRWRKEERNTLRRVLRQGFRLWAKYVGPASNAPA